jgi:hypothetical protein
MSKKLNKQDLQDFVDYTMANRSAPYKRIIIGDISESAQRYLKDKFGVSVQTIKTDNSSVIHAMNKEAHNLELDDLQYMTDVINTSQDITLAPKEHNQCKLLIFRKDIGGEITVLAEVHPKYETLLVFDAWRKKPREHATANANKDTPSANVRNANPSAVTPLSDTSEKKSSAFMSKERNSYDFQDETQEKDEKTGERDERDGKTDKEGPPTFSTR